MLLKIEKLDKCFTLKGEKIQVFRNLDLSFQEKEICCIMGPNGCGKTTLFNLIAKLDNHYNGHINILPHYTLGYMTQEHHLLPWRNVYENIILGLEIKKTISNKTVELVNEYLEHFEIPYLINSYPKNLSGGEKQKVSLIRTLIMEPDILLMDESFSALDSNIRNDLQVLLRSLIKRKERTALFITHDIDEAIILGDRTMIFDQKPNGLLNDIKISFDIPERSSNNVKSHNKFITYYSKISETLRQFKYDKKNL